MFAEAANDFALQPNIARIQESLTRIRFHRIDWNKAARRRRKSCVLSELHAIEIRFPVNLRALGPHGVRTVNKRTIP